MARVTNAQIILNQIPISADPFGNNIALICPACKAYPVLLIARPNFRGSSPQAPSFCRACEASVWIQNPLNDVANLTEVSIGFASADVHPL